MQRRRYVLKKLSIITNFRGMRPFVLNIIYIMGHLLGDDIEIIIIDYGSWANLNYKGDIIKSYSGRILLSILKLPLIRRYIKPNLLKTMIVDAGEVDYCYILYIHPYVVSNYRTIRELSRKLLVQYAGSDFFRTASSNLAKHHALLDVADSLLFGSESFMDKVIGYLGEGYRSKSTILPLPMSLLANMDSEKHSRSSFLQSHQIDHKKKLIAIGYNGIRQQQHLLCLKAIKGVLGKNTNWVIMIQATYSFHEDYERELKGKLDEIGIEYRIIKEYMSEERLSEFRLFNDIVINVQTTDASNASLLEHLAGGAVVIVGDWLPYDHWIDKGIYYHKTSLDELPIVLQYCIDNLDSEKEKCKKNKQIIMKHYSKEALIPQWRQVFGVPE